VSNAQVTDSPLLRVLAIAHFCFFPPRAGQMECRSEQLVGLLHRHAAANIAQADGLLFGRVTYEMMEAAFRPPAGTGARPDWLEPVAMWYEPRR
jgi:hypothetical protein